MDPKTAFCPNTKCPARGQVGQGNIGVHNLKQMRNRCHECGKTFTHTKGTVYYRPRYPVPFVTQNLSPT